MTIGRRRVKSSLPRDGRRRGKEKGGGEEEKKNNPLPVEVSAAWEERDRRRRSVTVTHYSPRLFFVVPRGGEGDPLFRINLEERNHGVAGVDGGMGWGGGGGGKKGGKGSPCLPVVINVS